MLERGGIENIARSSSNQISFNPRAHRNSLFPLLIMLTAYYQKKTMLTATVWFSECAVFCIIYWGWPFFGFSLLLYILGWFICWAVLITIYLAVDLLGGVWKMAMV